MIYLTLIQFFDTDEKHFLMVARQVTYERAFLASILFWKKMFQGLLNRF